MGGLAVLCLEDRFWDSVGLFYVSISSGMLGIAYAGLGGKVIPKSQSGKLNTAFYLIFGAYFLMNEVFFWIYRMTSPELAFKPVSPNLYFGRRLTKSEAAEGIALGWQSVLDLAVEFSEIAPLRKLPGYRSLPLLDSTAPSADQINDAVVWLKQATSSGPVYVHCVSGHGRTTCIVAAYLVATGAVRDTDAAITKLQELRPSIRLSSAQLKAMRNYQHGDKLNV